LFFEDFINADIFLYSQLLNKKYDYFRFDDLVHNFHLAPDQNLFHQNVKFFLAIPESWENNNPFSTPIISGSADILQLFKHNANET